MVNTVEATATNQILPFDTSKRLLEGIGFDIIIARFSSNQILQS